MKTNLFHLQSSRDWLYWLGGTLFLLVLIRTAWQSDDAYITYRCIDNALHGHGLTFNVAERVQAFTHPLWALFQLCVSFFSGEVYFTGIFSGIFFTLMTLWVIARKLVSHPLVFFTLCGGLMASSAFVDYATSGLENSLSYFLVVLFLAEWIGEKRLGRLSLIAALLVLNRMDLLLLVGPGLAMCWWPQRSFRTAGTVIIGFLPLILWELFAVFYYGFPFPNTAYAKLNVAIPSGELFSQGLDYLWASVVNDIPTVIVLVCGLGFGLSRRRGEWFAPTLGILIYLVYVVKIGGDFMEGRFLTVPFLLAAIITWKWLESLSGQWPKVAICFVLLGVAGIQYPASFLTGQGFHREKEELVLPSGVADERAYYYSQTGLLRVLQEPDRPIHEWMNFGYELKETKTPMFLTHNMGFLGYAAGPSVYLVDAYALTDPLLARFPPIYTPQWRPGHFGRAIPRGYLRGLAVQENRIEAPDIRAVYDELRLVTRGNLWSWERIKTIFHLNTGGTRISERDRFLYPVFQSRDADYPIYPGESVPANDELRVRLGNHLGVRIAFRPYSGELHLRLVFGEATTYIAVYQGQDGYFQSKLISTGEEGVVLNEQGELVCDWDLSSERAMQEGDFLMVYGMHVYGEQPLQYVQVGKPFD